MKQFFVEGLALSKRGVQKRSQGRTTGTGDMEVISVSVWAETPDEALKEAAAQLKGRQWQGKPRITTVSEEQRMRDAGAPELPGMDAAKAKKKKK